MYLTESSEHKNIYRGVYAKTTKKLCHDIPRHSGRTGNDTPQASADGYHKYAGVPSQTGD